MPRGVFGKFSGVQLPDVRIPTTDGRELLLVRRSEADTDARLVMEVPKLEMPGQAVPRMYNPEEKTMWMCHGLRD